MQMLIKPKIENLVLKNMASEQVLYLNVDEDLNLRSLRNDLENGALFYKGVLPYIEKHKYSRVTFISTDHIELGYMAVTYIANSLNKKHKVLNKEELFGYTPFAKDSEYIGDACNNAYVETWCENETLIPIIDVDDVLSYLGYNCSEKDGQFLEKSRYFSSYNTTPFWTKCNREAIILLCDPSNLEEVSTVINSFFDMNKKVYILFYTRNRVANMSTDRLRLIKNELLLNYCADEIEMSLEGINLFVLGERIIRENLKRKGVRIEEEIDYKRIIRAAMSMRPEYVFNTMDRIIDYALRDYSDPYGVSLINADFDFLNRFERGAEIPIPRKRDLSPDRKTASERLRTEFVGIDGIIEQVFDVVNVMKFNKIRSNMDIKGGEFHNVHVMLGAPGTAKTTVAKLMGEIMVEEGLLRNNRCVIVNGAQLKGAYVGQTTPKVRSLFDKHDVIIIDEAYSLVEDRGDSDSFGTEAIAQLIVEIEKFSKDKLIIFAGYGGKDVSERDDKMKHFLNANPGIKSRITSTFVFESYTPEVVTDIFFKLAKLSDYSVDSKAKPVVLSYFNSRVGKENFGNGREARKLLENSIVFTAKRVMKQGKDEYSIRDVKNITLTDVRNAISKMEVSSKDSKSRKTQIGFA